MDYGFAHDGKVVTPDQTPDITTAENDARNAEISRALLAEWQTAPDHFLAYYHFDQVPGHELTIRRTGRSAFLHGAVVTLWTGEKIGAITSAYVYRHNFGGRMVAIRVTGTNGAEYYGRASWDWGTVIKLRKVRTK